MGYWAWFHWGPSKNHWEAFLRISLLEGWELCHLSMKFHLYCSKIAPGVLCLSHLQTALQAPRSRKKTSCREAELHGWSWKDTAQKKIYREFPGGLAVRIPGFHCHGPGSIPGRGTEIQQAMQHSQKKKRYANDHWVHVKWFTSTSHIKIKPQGDDTTSPSEWLKLKRLVIPSVGEDVEQPKLMASWWGL